MPVRISVVGDSGLHGSEVELHLQNGDSQKKSWEGDDVWVPSRQKSDIHMQTLTPKRK